MTTIEAGTLNASTGAEEASDSIVRFAAGEPVTAGLIYEFVYGIDASDPALFFYDAEDTFLTKISAATGEAPEGATSCRAILDTSGVTEFGFDFRVVPEYDVDASVSLSGSPADLTWYMGDGTVLTGFEAQHSYENSLVKSIAVYARVKDWTGVETFAMPSCDLVGTCRMPGFDVLNQADFDLSGNPLLTGIEFAAVVSGQLQSIDVSGCNVSSINWTSLYGCLEIANCAIDISNNGLTESQVDAHLIAIDEITDSGYSGRTIDLSGTNAAPGEEGEAAAASLEDKGWTVTVTT